jgi:NhaA family Na+:H+ antiporter
MPDHDSDHHPIPRLPREPIDTLVDPLKRFMHIESSSGIVLLISTIVALILANGPATAQFLAFWKTEAGLTLGSFEMKYTVQHWINDFLMAIFFFVIGLEVKRELVIGELREFRKAALPLVAALGGMVAPALVYLFLQGGAPAEHGWGIPMATDIAFVVGCLAILGPRIPNSLRVMLLSLAIADDIGAILVIAIGYTENLNFAALALSAVGIGLFLAMMRVGVQNAVVYAFVGIVVWYGFHESGIHATIAGVLIGLLTPTKSWISEGGLQKIVRNSVHFMEGEGWSSSPASYQKLKKMEIAARRTVSPLKRFEIGLHPWVGFVIMPVFALANAGVPFSISDLGDSVALSVMAGLVLGKPIGIVLFSWIATKAGLTRLPEGVNWLSMLGAGFLAGIGFTMALFISGLALEGALLDSAKVGVLVGSIVSATLGITLLVYALPKKRE